MPSVDGIPIDLDDTSFFKPLEKILGQSQLLDQILTRCNESEENFRDFSIYLSSRERIAPLWVRALKIVSDQISHYTSGVLAFHGCRWYPHSTYLEDGINSLTEKWMLAETVRWAGRLPPPGSEAERVIFDYLRKDLGCVYAVKSLGYHQELGGYCHARGSEAVGNVLRKFSQDGLDRMIKAGTPTILKFCAPLESLDSQQIVSLCSDMVRLWISQRVPFPRPSDPRQGGFVFKRSIPANWLVSRYSCDDAGVVVGEELLRR